MNVQSFWFLNNYLEAFFASVLVDILGPGVDRPLALGPLIWQSTAPDWLLKFKQS